MKASALESSVKELYEQDFFEWTVRNAGLIRSSRLAEVDLEHIAEEIEDRGKSERHQLRSRVRVLLSHLLKWRFHPGRRSRGWRVTIRVQRDELVDLLGQMPSHRVYLRQELPKVYSLAVETAIAEADLPDEAFPPSCPFTLDQILDADFFLE